MELNLPLVAVIIIALVASYFLSGFIIKTAKKLARFLVFAAVFYIILKLIGLL